MFSKTDIEKYFIAEKQGSLLFLVIGVAAILLAVVFYFSLKTSFYKGIALPLLVFGLLFGIIGYTVYTRSDADRTRNVYAFDMNPGDLKNKEIPRMEKVMKNFVVYKYAEIALAIIGILFFIYFKNNQAQSFLKGVGLMLCIMALMALTADYFAAKRGKVYLEGLQSRVGALKAN